MLHCGRTVDAVRLRNKRSLNLELKTAQERGRERGSDTENTKEQSTKLLSLACRGAIVAAGEGREWRTAALSI